MLHYQQIPSLVPKRIRVQTLELQQSKAQHSSSVSVDILEEELFRQEKFRFMALIFYFCFVFMIITQYETLIGIYHISVKPIGGDCAVVVITRSCTFLCFLPVYYYLRRRTFKELVLLGVQLVILGQILNSLSLFFGNYMYYISSPLFSVSLVLVGFLPQRVATLWFFQKYRMQVYSILYFASYSAPSFVQILQRQYGVKVGFATQQNLKFGLIFSGIILILAIAMLCCLRQPLKPVSGLALQQIEPIKQGIRATLCSSSFFYKIALGLVCNHFADWIKTRLILKISHKGPYLHLSQVYIVTTLFGNLFACLVLLLLGSKISKYLVPVYKLCILCLYLSYLLSSFILNTEVSIVFNFIEVFFQLLSTVIGLELLYIVLQPLNPVYLASGVQQLISLLAIVNALIQYTTKYHLKREVIQIVITVLAVVAIALLFSFRSPLVN